MYEIGIVEPNFRLGRMHIDIVIFRRHLHKQKHHRVLVRFHQSPIGFFDRVQNKSVANKPAIQKQILIFTTGSGRNRLGQQRTDLHPAFGSIGIQ